MDEFLKKYKRILICILTAFLLPAYAMGDSKEYAIKAAFIYNFAKFITWPEAPESDITGEMAIGILGEDPFGDSWEGIAGKAVGGRTITIKQCNDDAVKASTCHILFINYGEKPTLKGALTYLSGKPVLTISDSPHFAGQGGMIEFYESNNRVRFAINLNKCKQTGFFISSRLLKLAKIIDKEDVEGLK